MSRNLIMPLSASAVKLVTKIDKILPVVIPKKAGVTRFAYKIWRRIRQ